MALSMTWDSSFEARPPGALNRNQLDNELRLFRDMTRQVMSQEHEFGYGTEDNGKHIPGETTLYAVGDSTERDALTDVPDGALFLLDGGARYELQAWDESGGTWVTVGYPNHSDLEGLTVDSAHPEFLLKSGGTLSRPVDLLNSPLLVDGATGPSAHGYSTGFHRGVGHPGQLSQWAASQAPVPFRKLKVAGTESVTFSWSGGYVGSYHKELSSQTQSLSSPITLPLSPFGSPDARYVFVVADSWDITGNVVDDIAVSHTISQPGAYSLHPSSNHFAFLSGFEWGGDYSADDTQLTGLRLLTWLHLVYIDNPGLGYGISSYSVSVSCTCKIIVGEPL